jgi:GNAT superfamily N-acetyltransferase
MKITYCINEPITAKQFINLLNESTLANRRPVEDELCMEGMVKNSNLMVTAWHNESLVGIARSLTDYHYACYLSDLAVHKAYQNRGIGRELQRKTQQQLGDKCTLILIAAPAADAYYGHIGFSKNPRCWVLGRNETIS